MRDHGFEHVDRAVGALRRKISSSPRAGVNRIGAAIGHGERRQPRQRGFVQPFGPFVLAEVKPVGRQRLVERAAARMLQRLAPCVIVIGNLLEALARGVLALRLDRHGRRVEIIEQRVHPFVKQR